MEVRGVWGKKNKPIFHVGRTESWLRPRGFFSLPNSFGNEYELRRPWMVLLWLVPSSFPGVETEKSTRRFYSIRASNHVYRNNSSFFNNTQVHKHEASESFVLFIHQPASSFHHLPVRDGYFKVTKPKHNGLHTPTHILYPCSPLSVRTFASVGHDVTKET